MQHGCLEISSPEAYEALASPVWRPLAAMCRPTREAEHAVSTLMLGPLSPNTYDRRPQATESAEEVAWYTPRSACRATRLP